jgi:hypothetical protein
VASNERENARRRKERIPGVVIDNLEDLIAIFADELQEDVVEMMDWIARREVAAREKFDNKQLADLLRLSQLIMRHQEALARADRKVRDARNAEYRDRGD